MTRKSIFSVVVFVMIGLSLTAGRSWAQEKPKLMVESMPAFRFTDRTYKIEAILEDRQSVALSDTNAGAQRVIVIKQAFDPNSILCIEHPAPVTSRSVLWGSTTLTSLLPEKPKGPPDSPVRASPDAAAQATPAPETPTPAIPARTCKTVNDWLIGAYVPQAGSWWIAR